MAEIVPAILPHSYSDLAEHIERLRGVVMHVQVDVVDGIFAHGKTWPYKDAHTFETIVKEERGLPRWDEVDFEFDLMVEDPAAVVMDYVHAGASRIVIHAKSRSAEHALQQLVDLREETGAFSVKAGVALGAHQSPDDLLVFEAQYDFVQVMGIEHEGKQGEPFDPRAVTLLERLRHRYPTLPLQIDGGVKQDNARRLVQAGASRLIVGSALFGAEDIKAAYEALYNEANAH